MPVPAYAAKPVLGRPPVDGSDEQIEAWAMGFLDQALGTAEEPAPEDGEMTESQYLILQPHSLGG